MKKLLFVLVLSIGSTFGYSQLTDTTISLETFTKYKDMADSSKVTFSKVYTDVKSGISGLAAALKVGAAHVYGVLTKQQIVKSIVNLFVYVALLFCAVFCYRKAIKGIRRTTNPSDDWYKDEWGEHTVIILPAILACLFTAIGLINFACTISETITGFVNPEYGAIKDIFDFINPPKTK